MGEITLRPAREEEVPAIVGLLHAAFEEFRGRLDPPSGAHAETEASLRRKLAAADCLLAEIDGALAGCVFVERQPGRLYFSRLATLPAFRRRGVGRTLIEAVETRARAGGLPRVGLDVRLALADQRAYYERLGYREVGLGAHSGYPAPTFAHMEKEVGPAGLVDLLDQVTDQRSFFVFVRALIADREASVAQEAAQPSSPYGPDAGGWENATIQDFLEAALSWAESTDMGRWPAGLEPLSWRAFATFLYCGKIYE